MEQKENKEKQQEQELNEEDLKNVNGGLSIPRVIKKGNTKPKC